MENWQMTDTDPLREAFNKGFEARKARKPARTNPYVDAMAFGVSVVELKALHKAWKKGHKAAGKGSQKPRMDYDGAPEGPQRPEILTRPAVVPRTRAPARPKPAISVPEGEELPRYLPRRNRRAPFPCQSCRVVVYDGGQACYVRSSDGIMAYCRCRACGARFSLPIGPA